MQWDGRNGKNNGRVGLRKRDKHRMEDFSTVEQKRITGEEMHHNCR